MQVGEEVVGEETKEFLVSGSRDRSVMVWDIIERKDTDEEKEWGVPRKILKGKFQLFLIFTFRSLTFH